MIMALVLLPRKGTDWISRSGWGGGGISFVSEALRARTRRTRLFKVDKGREAVVDPGSCGTCVVGLVDM